MSEQTDHIRRLNDMARTQPEIVNATWVMTQGVAAFLVGEPAEPQSTQRVTALRQAIATFTGWTKGDDPYGEHDFGTFTLFGARLYFKVDYYHPDHDMHAPVPGNVELCRRVLTIMLAEEC